MPNKSDSAGKLHQYFTTEYLKLKSPQSGIITPLGSQTDRDVHLAYFSEIEIDSIKKISDLSADCIKKFVNDTIISIEDVGISSGAVGNDNTDDLRVTTKSKGIFGFSLKCSKDISQILSKNPGAKSLLSAYFNSEKQQIDFNDKMEKSHLIFLNARLKTNHDSLRKVKKVIEEDAKNNGFTKSRFEDSGCEHMTAQRDSFLNELRNNLFNVVDNLSKSNLAIACNLILDTGKHHILGEYKSGKEKVEYINIQKKSASNILEVKKRGNDSLTIITNDYTIGFRFKFESGITSSIKLVGDYKRIN